jgi:hypothetical protein
LWVSEKKIIYDKTVWKFSAYYLVNVEKYMNIISRTRLTFIPSNTERKKGIYSKLGLGVKF